MNASCCYVRWCVGHTPNLDGRDFSVKVIRHTNEIKFCGKLGGRKVKTPTLISPKSGEIRMGHPAMGAFVRGTHALKIAKHGASPRHRIYAPKKTAE